MRSLRRLFAVVACAVTVQACGGSLSVIPTGPTPVSPSPETPAPPPVTPPPPPTPQPQTLNFHGELADGGWFEGTITYGTRDNDDRPTYGRFVGGIWAVAVHGGRTTRDVHFSGERGGRALIETYTEPFPAMGIIFVWPQDDPHTEAFTPHLVPRTGYDPDTQPSRRDFGELIPGSFEQAFGFFQDGLGGRALVTSFTLD